MAQYDSSAAPLSGWGQALREFLRGQAVVINNAVPGSSTLSFYREYWPSTVRQLRRSDVVLIQFGHNDERSDPKRHTGPSYYRKLLERFVLDSRKAGAVPVLVTPIPRYIFIDGHVAETHVPYSDYMRHLALEMKVPLLDLEKLAANAMNLLGEQEVHSWYMLKVDGRDTVHLTELGAENMARIAHGELIRLNLLLGPFPSQTH